MKLRSMAMLAAIAGMVSQGTHFSTGGIGRKRAAPRTPRTPDPEKQDAAQVKRTRKAAARLRALNNGGFRV